MKSILMILGIILLFAGIGALVYQGFSYTKEEKIAQIGEVTVTAEHQKTIHISPLFSGLCFLSGLALIVVARK